MTIDFHSKIAPTHASIGAYCNILFSDGDRVDGYYISFGEYEDGDALELYDNFGVSDTKIFYYAPSGEAELLELMKDNPYNDFKILSYELEYKND
jgi:hypothetical protein